MSFTTFSDFVSKNPNWEKTYKIYERDDDVYKRIPIQCRTNEFTSRSEYHACINTKTGDMWIDCGKRKIFLKHLSLLFLRPIDTIIRTLWHLTIVGPLTNEIYKCFKGEQTLKDLGINTLHSLADIIRTPAYGIAMTVGHLEGVILALFNPNSLYKTRDFIGFLEREYHRVDNILDSKSLVLSKCFSPWRNLIKEKDGTVMLEVRRIKPMLKSFAKGQVEYLRTKRFPCNNYGLLYPKNKPYVSAVKSNDYCCAV